MEATETPMRDHIAEFWRLLETEHVRVLVDIRRQTEAMTYYDSSSFGDDVAKALVADRAARPSPTGEKVEAGPVARVIRYMESIADASRRADGSDIPLGEQCRQAAATIAALEAERDEARHTITKANAAQDHLVEMAADWKARATTAEAALATANARVERLERAMEAVARYAWRADPPNANSTFTDDMRFSAIKYHPTVQEFGKPHVELAGSEARAALTGGENGR